MEQAYAYILTHPGIPCVFWKDYFERGSYLQNAINALVNARKVAGVHSSSELSLQDNAKQKKIYAARVVGTKGELYVRIGGTDDQWQPSNSNYADYRQYASGAGWKVWVKLPGNPAAQKAALNAALPVPVMKTPGSIVVADSLLN